MRLAACFKIFLVCLLLVLLVSLCGNASSSRPNIAYYCSTADPLGLVYSNSAAKAQRLSANVVTGMSLSRDGLLAVLTGGDVDIEGFVEVYRSGHRMLRKNLGLTDVDMVGWNGDALVIRNDTKLWQINPRTGSKSTVSLPADTKAIRTLGSGQVLVREASGSIVVEFDKQNGKKLKWERSGKSGSWTIVGDRYLVVETYLLANDVVDTTKSSLWIIDTSSGKQQSIGISNVNLGLCAGRKNNELLLSVPIGKNSVGLKAIDLDTGKQATFLSVTRKNALMSSLVGLSPDRKWLVMTTGYAEVGPGELWGLDLSNHKQVKLRQNVYECVLAP